MAALSPRARWVAVAALYTGMTLAYARTLLPVIGSALPNDTGDPGLNAWILWWNAQAVPLTTAWWNAPIFFPAQGALALSETFLNLWPLSTPMQWAGASAVLTYNVMFLLSFPAAALAAHLLAWRLTGRHDAALIAGLAFGFAPYRAAQMPHLQAQWSCWMPLALFALHGYLDERRRKYLVLFGVSWLMNALSTGYYLFFFAVLFGFWMLWFARSLRDWVSIGVAAVVASLPLAPLLLGYQRYQAAHGVARTVEEIRYFSADLSAIWATNPYVWHAWTLDPGPEGELYPGATILALVLLASLVAWWKAWPERRSRIQRWWLVLAGLAAFAAYQSWRLGGWVFSLFSWRISMTRPARVLGVALALAGITLLWDPRIREAWRRRPVFLFYVLAAVLMFVFALGPEVRWFGTPILSHAPYEWLMQLPGGRALRVPARFAMLLVLCLSAAAALAFKRLTPRGAHWAVAAPIILAVGFEGFVTRMEIGVVPAPLQLAGRERGTTILELPSYDDYNDTAAMLHATQAGFGLVNGFSGYSPPHYQPLKDGLRHLDGSVIDALRRFGTLHVYVHRESDRNDRYRDLVADLPGAERIMLTQAGTFFRLPARAPASLPPAAPLRIAEVRANVHAIHAPEIIDGKLETKWQTPAHQTAGDQITITLDAPAIVSRLEMDLATSMHEYPRALRVTVGEKGGQPAVVWERGTMGPAIVATLTDRSRMPIVLELTPHARGQEIVLTITEDDDVYPWSIAEIRVFGLK